MTKKNIKILPEEVIGKIAAGEVVERPASVVKELVENAIDAGAGKIEVKFEKGGINVLEVSDDGCGMTLPEIKSALKRYATSKIRSFEDLEKIKTMGFRGEALPSIAAVSKMRVISKTEEEETASMIRVEGGSIEEVTPGAFSGGTSIKVEELFFNVPARKKFLKKSSTERKHVISVMEDFAISKPGISFKVLSEKGCVYDFIPSSIKERFIMVAGKKLSGYLLDIDFSNPYLKIKGYISKPQKNYANKSKIKVFVNDRPVFSPLINHAVGHAVRSFIPSGRYPACVLKIEIDPQYIDVNVHPAKREIKFINQQGVHQIISRVLSKRMENSPVAFEVEEKEDFERNKREIKQSRIEKSGIKRGGSFNRETFKEIDLSKAAKFTFSYTSEHNKDKHKIENPEEEIFPRFQWKNKYVVGEDSRGVVIIDQHTAWERINYERLSQQIDEGNVYKQGCLIPEVIEIEQSRAQELSDNLDLFRKYGLEIEEFGPGMFKVTAVPAVASGAREKVSDIVEEILETIYTKKEKAEINEDIIKTIACHSSVRAGDMQNLSEMREMTDRLIKCRVPHRCPHGRPVVIRFSEKELDSRFNR